MQALLECVRLRTFSKFGLQQMQVDAHYLQIYLWRFVSDEQYDTQLSTMSWHCNFYYVNTTGWLE